MRRKTRPPERSRPRRRIRKLRLLALLAVLTVVGFSAFVFGIVTGIAPQLEALDAAKQARQQVDGYVYANDGHTILAVLRGSQSRIIDSASQINYRMDQAIVAAEDKRFYQRRGLDLRGIVRALVTDIRHGKIVEGGSTIEQQFVKNAYISSRRTLTRKLKEAALAWQIDQSWSKQKILTEYLNTVYFGNGAYGVEKASRTYFGHNASKLTWAEAALLAGIPEDPSRYDPIGNPQVAKARRAQILQLMLEQGRIAPRFYRAALKAPLPKKLHISSTIGQAPYFGEYVKDRLIHQFGAKCVFGGGLRVRTTINLQLQKLAVKAVQQWLPDPRGPQAALVAIRPSDGAVLAMVGGTNFRHSQFNLAVQGERQPGSSFKAFVLATAIRQGIAPQTTFDSHPVSIYIGGRFWYVHNFESDYQGPIDLAQATTTSDNSVFAQLTQLVGPAAIVDTAKAMGITSPLQPYFAIGLGAEPVDPLEMARAYSTFANGGIRVDTSLFGNQPRAITFVHSSVPGCRIDGPNRVVPRRVLAPDQNALLTSLLEGVVTSGTGQKAALPDRPAAGKTGTTENYGDAWFVGYTPQLAVAVWVGYPNKLVPMLTDFHGSPVVGGTYPALIWKSFMESALHAMGPAGAPESFPPAPSLYTVSRKVTYRNGQLELDNGNCRSTMDVVYSGDNGPHRLADCKPNEVDVPRVVGQRLAAAETRLHEMPLTPQIVYKPARPKQRVDIVLQQYPAGGTLSSWDKVTLVLAKPLHGVVPRVVGLPLAAAQAKLRRAGLAATGATGTGVVVEQFPPAGVAAAPSMQVRLVVGRGSRKGSRAGGTATVFRSRG